MAVSRKMAGSIRDRLLAGSNLRELAKRLGPKLPSEKPLSPRIPAGNEHSPEGLAKRRSALLEQGIKTDHLSGQGPDITPEALAHNIENHIGFAKIPVGVIGPLRVNGTSANGDFYIPLATSEGALVASCNRGAYVISQSGGASVMCLTESVSRAPCFVFKSMIESAEFMSWVIPQFDILKSVAGATTSHGVLIDIRTTIVGKEVYVHFEFETGDAAGQNMVTIATDAICKYLVEKSPVKPRQWYVEGNFSGDKKATMLSFLHARGRKIVAEVVIAPRIIKRFIHTTPEEMHRYWEISFMGGAQSGSIGVQGHYANALAAVFIACGQDAACVSEASVGLTRMDITDDGSLYVSVSLPNMIVGTVGGGTHLPAARECLEMMGCYGENGARKLAEICAATVLAGEISIIGALAAGEFASAHAKYGRGQK